MKVYTFFSINIVLFMYFKNKKTTDQFLS